MINKIKNKISIRQLEDKYQIKRYLLVLIIILAAVMRLYQLGRNPPSLDWDEASLGYNAYSILKTGKDEFGRFLPISIRSFEDYKPALYTYLTVPMVYLFGLNEFAVRLPSAILGVLTVLVVYFLIREIFHSRKTAYLVSLFLCISPWHLQFSRVAFESNVGLFFVLLGILFFIKGLEKGIYLILSAVVFAVSFYAYHSPRLIVPILLAGWAVYFRNYLWLKRKYVLVACFAGILLSAPFIIEMFGKGKARFSSVTVLVSEDNLKDSISDIEYDLSRGNTLGRFFHNRRVIYFLAITKGYLDHFNLNFLFLEGDAPLRHHAMDMGMLYIWEALFIVIGIIQIFKYKNRFLIFWWFLAAPAASAITTGTPHAVRALLYLPIYQIFSSLGLIRAVNYKHWLKIIVPLLVIINVIFYLEMYYIHTPFEAASDWQYGYKQAVEAVSKYENGVNKVIFTYNYDQPHIFVLFYKQIDPVWYQKQYSGQEIQRAQRTFGKYEFRQISWKDDQNLKDVLFIGTAQEIPENTPGWIQNIFFPNGQVAFRVVKR